MTNLEETPVSQKVFMDIFHAEFNLAIKARHTDTCKSCDAFKHSIAAVKNDAEKLKIEEEKKKAHHQMVAEVKSDFNHDVKRASDKVKILTFDLQKALATPKLPTNIAFYKRQLWTYNLCIYDEGTMEGHMYVWPEHVASRGGQEVASCLLYHLRKLPPNVEEVILYSDSCGGQNRNIKVTLMLKHFLSRSSNLKKITQKFLVSGHSYNSCDRAFGVIEKASKKHETIATTYEWMSIIEEAKTSPPYYKVIHMEGGDFFSSEDLEKMICNRKLDVNKRKINWLKIREMVYQKDDTFTIYMKDFNGEKHEVNLEKKGRTRYDFQNEDLKELYPNGRKIQEAKLKDLKDLMPYLKPGDQEFFKDLHIGAEHDFVFASDEEE